MHVERVPTLGDNYSYIILCRETNEAAVVDAPEAEPVVAAVDKLGCNVTKILSTHHHPDHSAANSELSARYGAPVFGHVSDQQRLTGFTNGLEEGDRIQVGNLEARILFIPAHTKGHIAYVFDGAVFCGDTLFAGGCGRLFEGNPQMMHTALNEKLAALPDDTLVYPGHEYTEGNLRFALSVEPNNPDLIKKFSWVQDRRAKRAADWHDATSDEMTIPSTIGEERLTNPFMRARSEEIRANVRAHYPEVGDDPVQILGCVREMKDRF